MENENGIFFLVGSSGAGKTTLENRFLQGDYKRFGNFVHIVSHATRKKRENEKDGVDYYFISDEMFNKIDKEKGFIQTIEHAGSKKGSSKMEWEDRLKQGNIIMPVLLESALILKKELGKIDKKIKDNIHIIFLDISKEESLKRLFERTLLDINYNFNSFKKIVNDFLNGKITEKDLPKDIKDNVLEIKDRLEDIELLQKTKKYTKNIINVDNKNKDQVYNEFLDLIDKIFTNKKIKKKS